MNKLNPPQRQAVKTIDRHMLVLAGAGSGKTRVITEKIASLLKKHRVDAEQIVAVTFTNKAALEMRKRVAARVGSKPAKGLSISTFHTLGLGILRLGAESLGYKPGFSIFDAQDSEKLLQELLRDKNESYAEDERTALWQISNLKSALLNTEQAVKLATDDQQLALARLYARYQRQLLAYNAVDFDDLILQPVQLLRENKKIRQYWHKRLRYLLVDEYQDTNNSQYEMVRLLLGKQARLTAVGDDDQSIYAWRGAQAQNLQRLSDDFKDLQLIKLEQNYRSNNRILKCANTLIAHNPRHFEKNLWSELGVGDPVRVLQCADPEQEAEQVVAEILHLKFQKHCRFSEFAILYRGNHQSRLFESALRMHNIPYRVSGGTAFFERTEIKDLLAYLRLIVNSADDAALLRVINTPRREIGADTLEKLGQFASQQNRGLFEAASMPELEHQLSSPARKRLQRFIDWISELNIVSRTESAHTVLAQLIDGCSYNDWLLNSCKDKTVAEARMRNLQDLLDWVYKIGQQQDNGLSTEDLVSRLALMDIIERNEEEKELDAIQLLTLHAAKGLEFPYVFLVGMEEGLLPHRSSETDEAIEEERRLAYVGITRAQRALCLSFAQQRKMKGELGSREPSRFLKELPADDLQWQGQEQAPRQEKLSRGNANLESLRNFLTSV
ncbi:MAG: UvrD-helicase domain-containing protein [Gammaproteobacteria bacterium]|nr:UvrD-helicase domain-containing protein [Gammaproteobacteria bacterium]